MEPTTLRVAVIGATGYAGAEVVRLLANHPSAKVTTVTSERAAGRTLGSECPWLVSDLVLTEPDVEKADADVVFLCQETGFALKHGPALADRMTVIDLGADFRLRDAAQYETTYGRPHTGSGSHTPVYGLTEWEPAVKGARLIANPGCFPTTSLLGLMPLKQAGLVGGVPVIDAKSGVSGAGRSKKEVEFLFSEIDGSFRSYAVTGHRHVPEIEQTFGSVIRFTPHLVPMPRGLQATIHVPLSREISTEDLRKVFAECYAGRPFVRLVDQVPSTKQVLGSNRCDIYVTVDPRTQMAVIVSVIDNLVKGAAGQAIQNMNVAFGLPESTGLPIHGVWP